MNCGSDLYGAILATKKIEGYLFRNYDVFLKIAANMLLSLMGIKPEYIDVHNAF